MAARARGSYGTRHRRPVGPCRAVAFAPTCGPQGHRGSSTQPVDRRKARTGEGLVTAARSPAPRPPPRHAAPHPGRAGRVRASGCPPRFPEPRQRRRQRHLARRDGMASSDHRRLVLRQRDRQLQQRAAARGLETQRGPFCSTAAAISAISGRRTRCSASASSTNFPTVASSSCHSRCCSSPTVRLHQLVRRLAGTNGSRCWFARSAASTSLAVNFSATSDCVRTWPSRCRRFRGLRRRGTSWSSRERTRNRGWIRQWSSITGRLTGCVTIRRLPFHSNGARDTGRRGGACAGGCTPACC